MGHDHRREAVGKKPALMPDILTAIVAALAEALKRTWVDLMLCVASGKVELRSCKFAEHNYIEGILSWWVEVGGNEAGNSSLATKASAAAKHNANISQRKTCKQQGRFS